MKSQKSNFAIILALIFFGVTLIGLSQTKKEADFSVSSGDLLDVSISQGNINISTGSGNEVKVVARNILERELSLLTMEKTSDKVKIQFEGEDSDDFEIDLTIPEAMKLDIATGGGNISVDGNLKGEVDASTGGGNITFTTVSGKADISTGGGNIRAGDINGDADISTGGGEIKAEIINGTADLSTGGGNITVAKINNSAEISTGGGNISIGDIGGKADLSTGGGNIKIESIIGSANVLTGGGNVTLNSAKGKVDVSSGAGNISLKNISGSVDASVGAGDIYAELMPDGKTSSELNSGFGDITLLVPSSAKATIVASTSVMLWSGDNSDLDDIKSDFEPTNIVRNKERKSIEVTFKLNGGGSKIEVNTGKGEIEIRKLK